jgi:anaerobic selenocysteine-containing dehydrogenase
MELTDIRGYCALCSCKCATIAKVEDGRLVGVRPDRDHPNTAFCVKAGASPEIVYSPKRIRTPLKRTNPKTSRDPGWVPISWDEALSTIATRLNVIKAQSGAEAVAFSRPSPGGSQAADWSPFFDRFTRAFGSPNLLSSSYICQWGRDTGSIYSYGSGLPTPHFEASKTILIWGHNPHYSHVQNWLRIREGQRHGARLIVIDPRRTGTVDRADLWLQPKPGSDTALALGAIHVLIRDNLFDRAFVTDWSNAPFLIAAATGQPLRGKDLGDANAGGYVVWDEAGRRPVVIDTARPPGEWPVRPPLDADVELKLADGGSVKARTAFHLLAERVAPWTPQRASEHTGIPADQIVEFARLLGTGGPVSYYTYNGVEQHVDASDANRAICALYALTGWLEAEGGNVSFAGVKSDPIDGFDLLTPEQNKKRFGLKDLPLSAARRSAFAYKFYDAVLGPHPYKVRALVAFGGNLIIQHGDTARGRQALEALDFQVHADLYLNPTAETADIVLPTTTPWESSYVSLNMWGGPDTMARLQYRPAVIPPLYDSRPDLDVMFQLAVTLGIGDMFWNGNVDDAFRYLLRHSGVTLEQLKASPGGIQLDIAQTYRRYAVADAAGKVRGFDTPSRKVEIYPQAYLDNGYDPLPNVRPLFETGDDFPLRLTSFKLSEFCHSQGRGIPALRRMAPDPYVQINPQTAARFGITEGDMIAVVTPKGQVELKAELTDVVAPGVVAAQVGWWESCEELGFSGQDPLSATGANLNLILANDATDPVSGAIPMKSYPCTLRLTGRRNRIEAAPTAHQRPEARTKKEPALAQ